MKKDFLEPEAEIIELNASVVTELSASADNGNEPSIGIGDWDNQN